MDVFCYYFCYKTVIFFIVFIKFMAELYFLVDELLYYGIFFVSGLDSYSSFVYFHFEIISVFIFDIYIDTVGIYPDPFVLIGSRFFLVQYFILHTKHALKLVVYQFKVNYPQVKAGISHIIGISVSQLSAKGRARVNNRTFGYG